MNKYILAVETSCDETSLALMQDTKIISMRTFSQVDIHAVFGGVVPEVASRNHLMKIAHLYRQVMKEAGINAHELGMIAVTNAPGLIGALFVGVAFAKGLGYALNIPVIPVHHLAGHILSGELSKPELRPPYVAMVASGGHTHMYMVTEEAGSPRFKLMGRTIDDAAGEAFDKVAKMLGGPYPGGPFVEKLATEGQPNSIIFPIAIRDRLDFSFSGLKTAVLTKIKENTHSHADIAASFQYTLAHTCAEKLIRTAKELRLDCLTVTGGVACNETLRHICTEEASKAGMSIYFPEKALCNDNAAMIAYAAWRINAHNSEKFMDLSFSAGDTKHEIEL